MTTPHQRTRAVIQTREFLVKLQRWTAWPGLPDDVQREARRLLRHFPEDRHLWNLSITAPHYWGSVEAVRQEEQDYRNTLPLLRRRETCEECGNAYYPSETPLDCIAADCPYRER